MDIQQVWDIAKVGAVTGFVLGTMATANLRNTRHTPSREWERAIDNATAISACGGAIIGAFVSAAAGLLLSGAMPTLLPEQKPSSIENSIRQLPPSVRTSMLPSQNMLG